MPSPVKTVRPPGLDIDFDVLADDTIIGPAIERGAWEDEETTLFLENLEPGARVLDLGANVGWFACLGVLHGAEVHAFEPVPQIAELAARNVERANAQGPGHGTVYPFAAGAEPGTATIVLAPRNHGDNRVIDSGAPPPADMTEGETIEIRVERVDDHVEGPVRVMKIDTQGSEWLALQGAQRLLEASPRLTLLLEFWPYALRGAEPLELLRYLTERGFTLGKATKSPYPMSPERILAQSEARDDPVRAGMDLYGTRGVPFARGGAVDRARALWRRLRE